MTSVTPSIDCRSSAYASWRTLRLTRASISGSYSTRTPSSPTGVTTGYRGDEVDLGMADIRDLVQRQVADEHVTRLVRDHERDLLRDRDGLGRDAAGPEDRDVARTEIQWRASVFGARQVCDAELSG